jgi:hypothetical protein
VWVRMMDLRKEERVKYLLSMLVTVLPWLCILMCFHIGGVGTNQG